MFCYQVDLSLFIALWGIYNNELCATTGTEHCFLPILKILLILTFGRVSVNYTFVMF